MPIKINSTGGGSVSIDVPSTGGTYTLTAPANNATIFTTDGGAITGNVAFTSNNVTIGGQTASPFGAKNKIINGAMVIDQRKSGSANTPQVDGVYSTVDQWQARLSAAGKFTTQQNQGNVTPPAGFSYYCGAISNSAYSVSSTDFFGIQQHVEGYNITDLAWGTSSAKAATLSFWVYSSLTGTFGGALYNGPGSVSFPFSYTINSANNWEYKTVFIPGSTIAGTYTSTTNGIGITLFFSLGCGSTISGTGGSWYSTLYRTVTGATSVVGTNGAVWYLTGVQLEPGSVATPFEVRPYGHELALCQRYYVKLNMPQGAYFHQISAGGYRRYPVSFPVIMRTDPTVTVTGLNGSTSPGVDGLSSQGCSCAGNSTGGSAGDLVFWSSGVVTATAEI